MLQARCGDRDGFRAVVNEYTRRIRGYGYVDTWNPGQRDERRATNNTESSNICFALLLFALGAIELCRNEGFSQWI